MNRHRQAQNQTQYTMNELALFLKQHPSMVQDLRIAASLLKSEHAVLANCLDNYANDLAFNTPPQDEK